jgi:hypothetical protein
VNNWLEGLQIAFGSLEGLLGNAFWKDENKMQISMRDSLLCLQQVFGQKQTVLHFRNVGQYKLDGGETPKS